jgi:iron(III) transport system substrate-binding protein
MEAFMTILKLAGLKRGFFSVSLIIFSGLVLASCTSSSKEDTLYIYSSMDEPTTRALVQKYKEETGREVQYVRLSTGEAATRIEAERANPQASLWLGGVGLGHIQLKERSLTEAYRPSTAEKIPTEFKDAEGYWTGLYLGVIAFVSNTEQLERRGIEAPQTWEDLIKPNLVRQIQLPHPGTSGTSYNVLTALIQEWGEEKAFEYFTKLHANVSQYTRSGAAPANNAALGETTVALGWAHDALRLIHESRAPLQLHFPKEGTPYEIASVSLLKNGKAPELAKQFYDWLYTQPASQVLADFYVIPLLTENVTLKPQAVQPHEIKLIHIDLDWAGKSKERLVQQWNQKINS